MTRTKTKVTTVEQAVLPTEEGKGAVPAVQSPEQSPARTDGAPSTLLSIIDRASRDPTVDVDRLERLIGIYERQQASNARTEYNVAMSLAQEEMKGIRANSSNPQTKSKYASYGALDKAIRPIYTKHGFALSFNTGDAPKTDDVRVLCMVSHRGGHMQEHHIDMPADGKGAKGADVMSRTHATGAAVTYGTRYLAGMVFNLAILKDNDGNDAGDRARDWADEAIQYLNTAELDKIGLEKYRTEKEKAIAWLQKNAPDQFERYHIAYSNAAERAGIKKEEPKRGASKQTASSQTSQSPKDGADDGQPGSPSPGAGGDSPSEAAGKPGVTRRGKNTATDVVDQNAAKPQEKKPAEPMEFDNFKSTRPFLDFSSKWLAEPSRTPKEAIVWEAFYRESMKKAAESKIAWVIDGLADLMVQYNLILSKAEQHEREPREEG